MATHSTADIPTCPVRCMKKNFYAKCWLAISPTGQHIVYVQTLVPISRYNVCTLSSAYKRKSCLPAIINLHTELFSTNLFILCDLYAPLACSGEEHLPFVSHHAEHLHNIVHGLERFATFDAPHVAGCFPLERQRKQIGHTTAYCVLLYFDNKFSKASSWEQLVSWTRITITRWATNEPSVAKPRARKCVNLWAIVY